MVPLLARHPVPFLPFSYGRRVKKSIYDDHTHLKDHGGLLAICCLSSRPTACSAQVSGEPSDPVFSTPALGLPPRPQLHTEGRGGGGTEIRRQGLDHRLQGSTARGPHTASLEDMTRQQGPQRPDCSRWGQRVKVTMLSTQLIIIFTL